MAGAISKHGLVTDFSSRSPASRAYVALFEQLCLATSEDAHPCVVVTSPGRGEGRSSVASNLALCGAQVGDRRALLVDVDLENPVLAQRFGVQANGQFLDVLSGRTSLEDSVQEVSGGRLKLLASGSGSHAATLASRSSAIGAMLGQWRAAYDWVMIDTPPVLSSVAAMLLGRYSSGVLLVVRAGHTRAEVVRQAVSRLREGGVTLLGVVMNRREFTIPRYAYRSM